MQMPIYAYTEEKKCVHSKVNSSGIEDTPNVAWNHYKALAILPIISHLPVFAFPADIFS